MRLTFLLLLASTLAFSQTRSAIEGYVLDAKTKQPLAFATVGVEGRVEQTVSKGNGSFRLWVPNTFVGDSLRVSYIGYATSYKHILALPMAENIYLEESSTLLDEVVVTHAELKIRDVDKALRVVRGRLYAMETEVTNEQYTLFLAWLGQQGQTSKRNKADFDLSDYDAATQSFFRRYATQSQSRGKYEDSVKVLRIGPHGWADYPAVNVSFEGAQEYCRWLTEQYNVYKGRKKFKQVRFRLPTHEEWQIAALGFEKFQTWSLEDNMVDVMISDDSLEMTPKRGKRTTIQVGKDILYPWFGSYYYRRSPQNHKGCFLGNFKVDYFERPCPASLPAYDGWSMMARTASYFPNDMGLYDVVGNVAEMISDGGRACGGSWDDAPSEATIHSVSTYTSPRATIGFRVFMDVVEE